MASVNAYLKKLLYQYDCVVVPELGAFLTHYQPATFTEASGLYLPPRKRVAFNEALRLDDGILANYIMLHEPVTRDGAQRYISQFVSELRQQVQETGRFDVDGIGTFSRNDEGRLQFDPSLRHNFFGEAYGLSAIPAQSLTMQTLEAVIIESGTTALGPVLAQEETSTLVPLPHSRPYWRVAAVALLVGLGVVSYFSVLKPGEPFQSSFVPANILRVPATLSANSSKGTEKEIPKPMVQKTEPVAVPIIKAIPENRAVEAVAKTKPLVKTTIPAAEVVTPAVKAVRTEPQFTVIAGSFSSKRNAMRLKRKLRKAGYTDAFVIIPSQKGQLYKVAATGSADRNEAIASMGAISELAGTPSWIYKN